ncbi:MAG: hypothetical protein WCG10_01045 [Chlamydiota bacterium]
MELESQNKEFEDKFLREDSYIRDLTQDLYALDSVKEKFLAVNMALYSLGEIEKQITSTMNAVIEKLRQNRIYYEEIRKELKKFMISRHRPV